MRKETVTLNEREQQRVMVLNRVERGELTGEEAARLMYLCVRQVRRLLAAYRREGVAALAHGNRGRRPVHALGERVRKLVVELAQGVYLGCNHHHLTELLRERECLYLFRSTVRRILVGAGLKSPRRRRSPKHRCRRERYPQEGMLLQIDGSLHDWLEGRGPYLTLLAAIDDAAGTVPYALFREKEDAQGYFMLLKEMIERKGIPLALYSDRHGVFQRSPREGETVEEQLSGERGPTQFGRALRELGTQAIFALSPQAKGRVERLFGTLQDRLVSELRLAGASTLEEANKVLWEYLPRFNIHFGVPPAQQGSAYREVAQRVDLDGVLCFKYQRTVARDNTVRFFDRTLQLLPGLDRLSYTHARVDVQERLNGSLLVTYQWKIIAIQEAPPHPVTLRARKGARSRSPALPPASLAGVKPRQEAAPTSRDSNDNGRKPSPHHPWRKYPLVTKSLNY